MTIVFHQFMEDEKDEFWGPVLKKFYDTHPNIKIDRQWFPYSDITPKQISLAATNQIGDVVTIEVAPLTTDFRSKKILQPLDDYAKADKTWSEKDVPQFFGLESYTQDGKLWGYPCVGHPGGIQHYYNIDYLTKVGAPLPPADIEKGTFDYAKWTLDDLQKILDKGSTKSADGRVETYAISQGKGGEGNVALLRSFGGNYYSDDGTKCLINTPESIAGIEYQAKQYQSGAALPLTVTDSYTTLFPAVRIGIVVNTCIAPNITKLVGDKFKWWVAPPPTGPAKVAGTQISSNGKGMSRITKHPAEAWEVLKMTWSQEFGLGRFLGGLGSPGSRYDVWTDPKFQQLAPSMSVIYKYLVNPETAMPFAGKKLSKWSNPANGSWRECDNAFTEILRQAYDGKKTAKEACDEAYKTVQAIMDKPVA